jgi:hypothetical protein
MTGSIYNYAMMKALYDQGKDYLDSFWPFAIRVIPSERAVASDYVQKKLRQEYNLDVPIYVLDVILSRAEDYNYVRKELKSGGFPKYRLSPSGIDYVGKLESDKEVERRINALLNSMKKFFEEKDLSLSLEEIEKSIMTFTSKNLDLLIKYVNPSVELPEKAPQKLEANDKSLLEYVEFADQQEPDNYRTLENLVMGSIISALLYVEKPEDIARIATEKFDRCEIFLDTNITFSILGLHMKEFNEPAKELMDLLKKFNFRVEIFSFTIDEISRVLFAYSKENYRYPTSVKVNTLYSSLKVKGWTITDVREFIINIERTLQEHGIQIRWVKDVKLDRYTPEEDMAKAIKRYKPDQNRFHQNHDLAAIAKIKEIRGKDIRKIEDSAALFLTSDLRLSRFNLEMGHKQNGTISETVSDRLLTSILWLKNPNTKPPLKSIIAAHSRDLFINRRVWDKFYETLRELKKEGKIEDDDISTLFWHNYVEKALQYIQEDEVDRITADFVLEKIEDAGKDRKKAVEKEIEETMKAKGELETKLKETERQFSEDLQRSISEAELRKDREWLKQIHEIKDNLRESSRAQALKWSKIIASLLTILYVSIVGIACFYVPISVVSLVLAIIGGSGIVGLWGFRTRIENWLFERSYGKKLKEAKLDKIS